MTKPTKWLCAQRRLRSAWASAKSNQSSLSAWRKLGTLATHWVHSEDSDQTGWMPRMIRVFAGCTLILLVLSCRGSLHYCMVKPLCSHFRMITANCFWGNQSLRLFTVLTLWLTLSSIPSSYTILSTVSLIWATDGSPNSRIFNQGATRSPSRFIESCNS